MNVTLLGTGGTITSTDTDGGATPTKSGADLIDAVPELEDYASIAVQEILHVPSFELDGEALETIGKETARADGTADVDAVIITHGTDTIEETAYYLDVALQPSTPVFLTGAQRRPDETSPDGPANLLTTVRAARAFHDRDASGVFLAFNEEIHAARGVTKTHTSKLETFSSPSAGPVATLDHAGVRIHRAPTSESDHVPATELDAVVPMVKSGIGVAGDRIRTATERDVDGLVVEGTGLGNVTADIGAAIEHVAADLPIVVTSRCLAGRTASVYGSVGGGDRLDDYGAVFAADLPAHKARIKLQLALSAFDRVEKVNAAFTD